MVRAGCLLASSIDRQMTGFIYSEMGVDRGARAIEMRGSSAKADMAVVLDQASGRLSCTRVLQKLAWRSATGGDMEL